MNQQSKHPLRTFIVTLASGEQETVFAHYHDMNSPAGHLAFMVDRHGDGNLHVFKAIHADCWSEMNEIEDVQTLAPGSKARMN